ncbi:MAG: hypothetical protein H7Y60_07070 [Rhodospirillaceae bacterium]|nr:hypothetical protein [Rhodospirillales bacterium]
MLSFAVDRKQITANPAMGVQLFKPVKAVADQTAERLADLMVREPDKSVDDNPPLCPKDGKDALRLVRAVS